MTDTMETPLIDFHCHLDLFPDYRKAVLEAERSQVHTLAVTTTPRAWPHNKELTSGLRHVTSALGIHPQLVKSDNARELALWDKYLADARYIGEVGLDAGPTYASTLTHQKHVLEHILRACAEAGGKVLSVHAVRSAGAVLDMVEKLLPPDRGRVVLHWFTGTITQAARAVELGCYFSVNTMMLRTKKAGELIKVIPADRLLTETDGPFTRYQARPARPSDVSACVDLLACLLAIPPTVVANQVASAWRDLVAGDAN